MKINSLISVRVNNESDNLNTVTDLREQAQPPLERRRLEEVAAGSPSSSRTRGPRERGRPCP